MQSKTSSRGLLDPGLMSLSLKGGPQRAEAAAEGGIKGGDSSRIPLLWRGRIHFARWFGFKSAGTNPWHEVILCWSFSPKFIHQLFTVNGNCISVGNYEGWEFSLRQKECDTADTPNLMWRAQCPRGVRGKNYLCIRKQCARAKEKADTLF